MMWDRARSVRLDERFQANISAPVYPQPLYWRIPGSNTAMPLMVLALGKDGRAYLLDRNDLGGIGNALAIETVSDRSIRTGPATFPAADGIFVAFQLERARWLTLGRTSELAVLKIRAGSPPSIGTL
jgi:hypothetical protein